MGVGADIPSERLEGGELLAAISRRVVQVLRQQAGKGPTNCKAFWAGPDVLLVMLGGGYTAAERTLHSAGHTEHVLSYRRTIQDVLERDLRGEVERLTGRKVVAFMSSSHMDPDLAAELFVLKPLQDG